LTGSSITNTQNENQSQSQCSNLDEDKNLGSSLDENLCDDDNSQPFFHEMTSLTENVLSLLSDQLGQLHDAIDLNPDKKNVEYYANLKEIAQEYYKNCTGISLLLHKNLNDMHFFRECKPDSYCEQLELDNLYDLQEAERLLYYLTAENS